ARYLGRHGEDRVERAVFVGAMLPFLKQTDDNPEAIPEAALDGLLTALRTDRPKWLATQSQAYFATQLGTEASPAMIDWKLRMCLSASPWATLQVQQTVFHADNREQLRGLTIPTLVVHGDADFSAPAEVTGRRTAALIPGAVYKEYPAAGHGLYITHKDQLNADILDFIKS
ncbi:alpha/beta hydrolase, partial [Streptomyces sp. MCAF7]